MVLGIASLLITSVYADHITLNINDTIVPTLVSPIQEAGTTLVPLRIIGENLGATLGWDGPTQTVTITRGETEIKLVIGSKNVSVNNVKQQLLATPKLIEGTTMVPLRFISENLDSDVDWNGPSRTVFVTSKRPIQLPEKPLLLQGADKETIALDGAAISRGESRTMDVDVMGDGIKEGFIIERGSPNGTRILGIIGQHGQLFEHEFLEYGPGKYNAFDEYGELRNGYYAQITCYDLDGDGIKEVLVSVGDKSVQMETLIYRPTNEDRHDPFRLVGRVFSGKYIYIDKDHAIVSPDEYGGISYKAIYKNGQLYEIDETGEIVETDEMDEIN